MSRHASGTALIGPISGKPDIGDAGSAGAASQTAHSGGTGQPSGPPFEGWTRRERRAAEAARIRGPEGLSFPPGSYGAGDRNRRVWRAERRHVPETVRDYVRTSRRLARHPLDLRGGGKA